MIVMREFFKDELKALERNTGLKQYDKILDKDDWEKELSELLNALTRVCNQFNFIPNEDKAKIIKKNIISDTDFQGFNARIVYKWLSQAQSVYFKEAAHTPESSSEPAPILEGEERQKKLKEWLDSLGDGMKSVPQLTETEWKREGKIDQVEKKGIAYKSPVTIEQYEFMLILDEVKKQTHAGVYDFTGYKVFEVEKHNIAAISFADAKAILKKAKDIYDKTKKVNQ
jgi:hypothetical protein